MPALFENRAGKFFAVLFPFVSNNGKIILYGKDQNALKAGVRISHFAALGAGAEFSWKFILRRGMFMKFLLNKKLTTRIGLITSAITLSGMLFLWIIVSANATSMVKNNITNQMTDAAESRAAIIDEYVSAAEEYMSAFALGSEVQELLMNPDDPVLLERAKK